MRAEGEDAAAGRRTVVANLKLSPHRATTESSALLRMRVPFNLRDGAPIRIVLLEQARGAIPASASILHRPLGQMSASKDCQPCMIARFSCQHNASIRQKVQGEVIFTDLVQETPISGAGINALHDRYRWNHDISYLGWHVQQRYLSGSHSASFAQFL
jgi:hypothetical protein